MIGETVERQSAARHAWLMFLSVSGALAGANIAYHYDDYGRLSVVPITLGFVLFFCPGSTIHRCRQGKRSRCRRPIGRVHRFDEIDALRAHDNNGTIKITIAGAAFFLREVYNRPLREIHKRLRNNWRGPAHDD
jgi:hypothetical protein